MLKLYQHDLTPAQYAAGQGVICTLPKAIAPEAPLTINGDWSLSFAYPVGSLAADELQLDRLVEADGQLYRIEDVEKIGSADGLRLQIHAVHLVYDLRRKHIVNIETAETTPGGISQPIALDQILHGTSFTRGTVDTDIVLDYLDILQKDAMWALKEQVLPLWGGELQPDNWTVNIRKKMGADRGAQLRYGKNIDGVRLRESLDGTITRLHVLGYKNANIEPVNGGKDYIDSPNIGLYAQPIEGLVTFPDDDLPEDLLSKGQEYLATVDTPRISMTVDLAKVRGSVQYRHYKDLERVELGDTVTVYHQRLKIDITARIQARTYNPVTGENIRVVLGNDDRNLYSHIASLQQAAEIIKMIADRKGHIRGERLRGVIDLLTTKLYASGAYTTAQVLEDKGVLLENTDEASVDYGALYAGPGIFAIASEKDNTGQWIWRTFGTGQGFVGHEIIAHTITANKLASDVGQQLDLSSNVAITGIVEDINHPETGLSALGNAIQGVEQQLDGKIETYNQTADPAASWTTPELKTAHRGDLWYNPNTKETKRWSGTSWVKLLSDEAAAAQALAEKKRRVFVAQPVPPYDVGDLWMTSTAAGEADLMTCVVARAGGSYFTSDWRKTVKYTDDQYASTKYQQTNNAFRWLMGYGPAADLDIENAQTYLGLNQSGLKFIGDNVDMSANESIKMAVRNIKPGGRNLVKNSAFRNDLEKWTKVGTGAVSVTTRYPIGEDSAVMLSLAAGEESVWIKQDITGIPIYADDRPITLSFDYIIHAHHVPHFGVLAPAIVFFFDENNVQLGAVSFPISDMIGNLTANMNQYRRAEATWVIPAGTVRAELRLRLFAPAGEVAAVYYGRVQLEYGNKATPWRPAEEDLESRVSAAEFEITDERITQKVTTSQKYTQDIQRVEGKAEDADEKATTAKGIAESKSRTYHQPSTSPPSDPKTGDLWFQSDKNNNVLRFSQTAWFPAHDVRLDEVVTRVTQELTDDSIIGIVDSEVTTASGDTYQSLTKAIQAVGQVTTRVTTLANGIPENESILNQADNRISAKVSDLRMGGANLVKNSAFRDGLKYWSKSGGGSADVVSTYPIGEDNAVRLHVAVGQQSVSVRQDITGLPVYAEDVPITLSFDYTIHTHHLVYYDLAPVIVYFRDANNTHIGTLGAHIEEMVGNLSADMHKYRRAIATGILPAGAVKAEVLLRMYAPVDGNGTIYFGRIQLELGNKETPWSQAESDPASGVKAAGIEIGPGTFNAYASLAFDMLFGSGANEFGMSNHRPDLMALWAGGNPANAKTRLWMDGAARFDQLMLGNSGVNQFTQMYPYADADNADPDNSMVFKVFIPSDCSGVQSLKLSFQLEQFRADSTGAASGGASTQTSQAMSGGATVNTGNTGPVALTSDGKMPMHNHLMGGHWHKVSIPAHTHPIAYGIYKGPTATACQVIVDGVNIGSFASLTAQDITAHLAKTSGKVTRDTWHTIELKPNGLTRIVAQAFLVAVVATATNAIY